MIRNIGKIFAPKLLMSQVDFRVFIHGIKMNIDDECCCAGLMPRLIGDSRRLKQVLINLVKNAIKFTEEGFVEVQVSYGINKNGYEKQLDVAVCDSGTGIAP